MEKKKSKLILLIISPKEKSISTNIAKKIYSPSKSKKNIQENSNEKDNESQFLNKKTKRQRFERGASCGWTIEEVN